MGRAGCRSGAAALRKAPGRTGRAGGPASPASACAAPCSNLPGHGPPPTAQAMPALSSSVCASARLSHWVSPESASTTLTAKANRSVLPSVPARLSWVGLGPYPTSPHLSWACTPWSLQVPTHPFHPHLLASHTSQPKPGVWFPHAWGPDSRLVDCSLRTRPLRETRDVPGLHKRPELA